MALDTVLSDLEAIGYEAGAYVFPAVAVGAWHRRDRVAIVAYSTRKRLQQDDISEGVRKKRRHTGRNEEAGYLLENYKRRENIPESRLGGMANGLPNWVDEYWGREPEGIPKITNNKDKNAKERIKCLGNAVVPMQFYPVFKAIAEAEKGE